MAHKYKIIRLEEAREIARAAFRQKYPPGTISAEVLWKGTWNTSVGAPEYNVYLVYHFKGMGSFNPFIFFEAVVNKTTGEVSVVVAEDPSTIPFERLQGDDEPDSEFG